MRQVDLTFRAAGVLLFVIAKDHEMIVRSDISGTQLGSTIYFHLQELAECAARLPPQYPARMDPSEHERARQLLPQLIQHPNRRCKKMCALDFSFYCCAFCTFTDRHAQMQRLLAHTRSPTDSFKPTNSVSQENNSPPPQLCA